jgi:E3 Ubiquitin ligase
MPFFFSILVPVLSLLCLWGSHRTNKRRRLIGNLPTSKTQGIFIGLVELKGTAESEQPLQSYLAEEMCVLYSYRVEEEWRREVEEEYTDGEGRTQTRTRIESGWNTIASGGEDTPFYLLDDTGVVLVRPEGAEIRPAKLFSETCTPVHPLYYGKGPGGAVMDSTFVRRFVETGIP